MINNFLKQFILIFFSATSIFYTSIVNTYAYVDIPKTTTFGYSTSDGKKEFKNSRVEFGEWYPYLNASAIPGVDEKTLEGLRNGQGNIGFSGESCALNIIAAYASFKINVVVGLGTLATLTAPVYALAKNAYEDLELCGSNWYIWGSYDAAIGSVSGDDLDVKKFYPFQDSFYGSKKAKAIQCKKDITKCSASDEFKQNIGKITGIADIRFKEYREVLYDGEEFRTTNKSCYDPRPEAEAYDVNQGDTDENGPLQLYYMKGSFQANYACDRFYNLIEKDDDKFDKAYKCCVGESKSVCINRKGFSDHIYCPSDGSGNGVIKKLSDGKVDLGLCWMDYIAFKVSPSSDTKGEYCVNTWSFCPYNFNIERGTEKILNFNDNECYDDVEKKALSCNGKIKNFYQYKRHCTVVESWKPNDEEEFNYPAFLDKSCINFVGSSHNTDGYKSYYGYRKNFNDYKSITAPMAECVSESLKNFLFNRAGYTKCKQFNEVPDENGNCGSGYEFLEGTDLSELETSIQPPSALLLRRLHNIIILVVTLMITLYGYNIMVNQGKMEMKSVITMLIKMVIVLVFSLNNWWYSQLFRFVYSLSNSFSMIVTKIAFDDATTSYNNQTIYMKYDGCYFGNPNSIYGAGYDAPAIGNNNYSNYPNSRKYVAFFDSLDCKIAKYLGYSGDSSFKSKLLLLVALALIFPFSTGLFVAVGALIFALFIINFAIYAVYVFIISALGLTLMLLLSPIFIPCILFKKWQPFFFDKWVKTVLGYALQPMILFAYITVALIILDNYTIGSGAFNSPQVSLNTVVSPTRSLICGYSCNNENGDPMNMIDADGNLSNFRSDCVNNDNEVVNMKQNSVLCFLDGLSFSGIPYLLPLGISISELKDFTTGIIIAFLRAGLLMFILTKVLYTVPGIAMTIVGARLPNITGKGDPFQNGVSLFNAISSLRRGVNGLVKTAAQKMSSDKENGDENKT